MDRLRMVMKFSQVWRKAKLCVCQQLVITSSAKRIIILALSLSLEISDFDITKYFQNYFETHLIWLLERIWLQYIVVGVAGASSVYGTSGIFPHADNCRQRTLFGILLCYYDFFEWIIIYKLCGETNWIEITIEQIQHIE